jgi:hypothetical protein
MPEIKKNEDADFLFAHTDIMDVWTPLFQADITKQEIHVLSQIWDTLLAVKKINILW